MSMRKIKISTETQELYRAMVQYKERFNHGPSAGALQSMSREDLMFVLKDAVETGRPVKEWAENPIPLGGDVVFDDGPSDAPESQKSPLEAMRERIIKRFRDSGLKEVKEAKSQEDGRKHMTVEIPLRRPKKSD